SAITLSPYCSYNDSYLRGVPIPLASTLFPYTTLFRSCGNRYVLRLAGRNGRPAETRILTGRLHATEAAAASDFETATKLHEARIDRKSTRLNSSHLGNSYAVFCLKKKNRKLKTNTRNP